MNNNSNTLIDESEIRAALSFLRIDRDAFGHGVRQRVKQAAIELANTDDANLKDRGGLLRIAASVMPVNLLGANTTVAQTPFVAVGFFQKAIAYLALPAISFLMILVTIFSSSRIRRAQQSDSLPEADMARIQDSVYGWWRRYGWIAAVVYGLALAAPFMGWTTPLLLLFMASAIGTASIITALGKAGLVDRNAVGGYCIAMMGLLGSASLSFAISNGTQLLDPRLVSAIFYVGGAFLILFVNPIPTLSGIDANPKESKQSIALIIGGFVCMLALILLGIINPTPLVIRLFVIFALSLALGTYARHKLRNSSGQPATGIVFRGVAFILIASAAAFFGQSLWRPIGTATLVEYAKSFDPQLVGYWGNWQATERWLQDQGINYDHSAVQARWVEGMEDSKYPSIFLNHAVSTGLTFPSGLIETEEFKTRVQRLLSPQSAGTQIFSIEHDEYVIAILAKEQALTDQQRDHLADRLLATWRSLDEGEYQQSLVTATTITNMLSLIDRPVAEAERRADVGRWLRQYQCISSRPFIRSGGFKNFLSLDNSDLMATDHAVRLMQHYGIHNGVDVLALRAFLRPSSSDHALIKTASVRASTRQRLDQVPGIPRPSLWDYIRLNQSLWFAILLVGICIYATLGSPQIIETTDRETTDQK